MYNLPSGVKAALVIKNASTCTSNPCDFEKGDGLGYPTVACVHAAAFVILMKTPDVLCSYAEPFTAPEFNDPPTKFWQGGKKGAFLRFGTDALSLSLSTLTSFVIQQLF
jgi:hypothetical protein